RSRRWTSKRPYAPAGNPGGVRRTRDIRRHYVLQAKSRFLLTGPVPQGHAAISSVYHFEKSLPVQFVHAHVDGRRQIQRFDGAATGNRKRPWVERAELLARQA